MYLPPNLGGGVTPFAKARGDNIIKVDIRQTVKDRRKVMIFLFFEKSFLINLQFSDTESKKILSMHYCCIIYNNNQ